MFELGHMKIVSPHLNARAAHQSWPGRSGFGPGTPAQRLPGRSRAQGFKHIEPGTLARLAPARADRAPAILVFTHGARTPCGLRSSPAGLADLKCGQQTGRNRSLGGRKHSFGQGLVALGAGLWLGRGVLGWLGFGDVVGSLGAVVGILWLGFGRGRGQQTGGAGCQNQPGRQSCMVGAGSSLADQGGGSAGNPQRQQRRAQRGHAQRLRRGAQGLDNLRIKSGVGQARAGGLDVRAAPVDAGIRDA